MKNKISIFDTGPGMDASDENSIVKWYVTTTFLVFFMVKVVFQIFVMVTNLRF